MSGSRSYPDFLQFQTRGLTTEASGQVLEDWSTSFSRWGKVVQLAASEGVADDQRKTVESYSVKLLFDVTAGAITSQAWRLIWRNQLNQLRTLNLTGVDTAANGRRAELVLSATLER